MARKPNSSPQTQALFAVLMQSPQAWRHGYDLSRETGLKSGTLYPILVRLEGAGLLEEQWEAAPVQGRPARHMYRLTAQGQAEAAVHVRSSQIQAAVATTTIAEGGVR